MRYSIIGSPNLSKLDIAGLSNTLKIIILGLLDCTEVITNLESDIGIASALATLNAKTEKSIKLRCALSTNRRCNPICEEIISRADIVRVTGINRNENYLLNAPDKILFITDDDDYSSDVNRLINTASKYKKNFSVITFPYHNWYT